MSDLISRSEALQRLIQETVYSKNNLIHINTIKRLLQDVESAYDIDKTVEELESFAKLSEDRWVNGTSEHAYQEHKCWVKAIEIVKQGGVSDDVCEWKEVVGFDYMYIRNPHTNKLYSNEPSMKNIYCNTCGKKIKIVGDLYGMV